MAHHGSLQKRKGREPEVNDAFGQSIAVGDEAYIVSGTFINRHAVIMDLRGIEIDAGGKPIWVAAVDIVDVGVRVARSSWLQKVGKNHA